jgi:hypothetical protein
MSAAPTVNVMSDGMVAAVKKAADYLTGATPEALSSIPAGVADSEAIHAVQKHYADAGFVCDEDAAQAIVDDAR